MEIKRSFIRIGLRQADYVSGSKSRFPEVCAFNLIQDKSVPNKFLVMEAGDSGSSFEILQDLLGKAFGKREMILVPALTKRTETIKRNLIRITQARSQEAKAKIYLEIIQEAIARIFRNEAGRGKTIWRLEVKQDEKKYKRFLVASVEPLDYRRKRSGQPIWKDKFYVRLDSLEDEMKPYGIEVVVRI